MTIAFFGRVRSGHIERKERSASERWMSDRYSSWNRWFDRLEDLLVEGNQANNGNSSCASQLPV